MPDKELEVISTNPRTGLHSSLTSVSIVYTAQVESNSEIILKHQNGATNIRILVC